MEPIKVKLLDTCLKQLTAIGCKFAVIDPDGKIYGDLPIVQEKQKAVAKHTKVADRWRGVDLEGHIKDMKEGDVRTVQILPNGSLEQLRSALSHRCVKLYGEKACTTFVNHADQRVEILRVM